MAFPTSPANNQTALVNGIVYQWNASLGVWKRNGSVNSITVGQAVLNSNTASTSNTTGSLIVAGGAGITGNLYTGAVYISSPNGITFPDGTVQTTAGVAVDSYARTTANAATSLAQASFDSANVIVGVNTTQNTNISIIQGVDNTQNTQIAGLQGVDLAQNSSISIIQGVDLTQNNNITYVNQYAASAYNKANTGGIFTGDVTIQQNLVVSGNVTITGNIISQGAQNLVIDDPLIYLANNNTGNTVDIGFVGNFTGGSPSIYQHTGFVRDATDGTWKLFSNVVAEPTTTVDFTYAVYDNLKVGAVTGNIIATTAVINGVDFTASQATQNTNITSVNQYAASAYAAANTNTSDISIMQGVNTTQNNNITAVNNYAASAYASSNTNSTNISIMQGVNTTQNTNITYADAKAQAAFDKANTGVTTTITDDTTNSGTYYPLLSTTTSGSLSTSNTSSSKLSFVPATGTLTVVDLNTTSDIKFKEDVQPIQSALQIINNVDGVSFTWKETGKKSYGVIANELQKVLPELVNQEERGLSVSYLPLIAILIEAVKEQQKQIDDLKKQ